VQDTAGAAVFKNLGGSSGRIVRFKRCVMPGQSTIQTIQAMISAWTADRVEVRLSPSSLLYGVDDGNKLASPKFVVRAFDARFASGISASWNPTRRTLRGAYRFLNVAETFRPMAPRHRQHRLRQGQGQ